jgi:surface antigen
MSSSENQVHSSSEGLQIPGLVLNEEPIAQLSFKADPQTPLPALSLPEPGVEADVAGLADMDTAHQPISRVESGEVAESAAQKYRQGPASSPGVMNFDQVSRPISQSGLSGGGLPSRVLVHSSTHNLLLNAQQGVTQELLMDAPRPEPGTTASRPPVVIRGKENRTVRGIKPPRGKRHIVNIVALSFLVLFTLGALLAVSPLGHAVQMNLGAQPGQLLQGKQAQLDLVAQATATAVVHQRNDGLDPSSNGGGAVLSTGSGSLSWPYGYCTYWANLRYHELTGNWVQWHGNADQWVAGARMAGWNVSSSPHVPSIIVLMDGVEGASYVGHVAVVESADGDVAHTSNMNWYANGGGFGIVSDYDFTAGSGVYFIWKD